MSWSKMDKYIERRIKKFVIANMDGCYLKRLPTDSYCFVKNIEAATKFMGSQLASEYIHYYYRDTGIIDNELLVVPVIISYELIKEGS